MEVSGDWISLIERAIEPVKDGKTWAVVRVLRVRVRRRRVVVVFIVAWG